MADPVGVEETPEILAARRRQLVILATGMVLTMSTWFSTAAVLPQLRDRWDLSAQAGSWLTISVQLGFVAGAVTSSAINLADRVSPRRLILFGALGAATANLATAASGGLTLALPTRFAVGMCLAAVYPPALKAMATWFKTGRGTALGVMVGALTLGSAMPHLVNGLGGLDWRLTMIVTSMLTVAGGVLVELAGEDGPFWFPSAPFDPRRIGTVFSDRAVRLASVGYFGHMWELYAMWAWFGTFFADVLRGEDNPEASVGASLAAFLVIGIGAVGSWVGGLISDKLGRTTATAIAMSLSGGTALVIGFARDWPSFIVIVLGLFWGFWVVADSAQFSTIVTEVADQRYVGTSLTLQLAVGFVLTVFTIFLVPVVRDAWGWGLAFALLAPGPLVGTIAMRRLAGLLAERAAAEAERPVTVEPSFVSPFF